MASSVAVRVAVKVTLIPLKPPSLLNAWQASPELEAAGMNQLRLIAVQNQIEGRREFSSEHVSKALAKGGGDTEMSLWARLDCEEAGVTLIKTLEALTDSAPAMYQFKHLSFQEGLFARNLLAQV